MTGRLPGHNRRSIRLQDYDYASDGACFVTLCTQGMVCYLGEPVHTAERDVMQLSAAGLIVRDAWLWLEQRYPCVFLDALVVMPNHLHGILILSDGPVETFCEEPHSWHYLANYPQGDPRRSSSLKYQAKTAWTLDWGL